MNNDKMIKVFNKYVSEFDMNNPSIKSKYNHSFKVMELCKNIGMISTTLSEEDIKVLELLGLVHDIGRFEQITKYHTMDDNKSVDHAKIGLEVLFDKGLIADFIDNRKYDEIIKNAVYLHNKYSVPDYIDEKSKVFTEVIRDADKIDIFRVMIEDKIVKNSVYDKPTFAVYNDFVKMKSIDSKLAKNDADFVLCRLAFIFDLVYKYSITLIKDRDYLDKYFATIDFGNSELKTFFLQIKEVMRKYIDGRIGE